MENKVGKWIWPHNIMWKNPKCSVCGKECENPKDVCPNCGAKMNESQINTIENADK